jgi:hypothetical protein
MGKQKILNPSLTPNQRDLLDAIDRTKGKVLHEGSAAWQWYTHPQTIEALIRKGMIERTTATYKGKTVSALKRIQWSEADALASIMAEFQS